MEKQCLPISGVTVFENFDQFCLLVAFFKVMKGLTESGIPDRVGVADKTEESNDPEGGPQEREASGSGEAYLHLDVSFFEISEEVNFLV